MVGAAKTINDKQIPTIALAAADEVTSPVAERRYVFKLGPNSADSAAALVAELNRAKTEASRSCYTDDLYGRGGDKLLDAELRQGRHPGDRHPHRVKPTATDITQAVGTPWPTAKPDALVVLAAPDQAIAGRHRAPRRPTSPARSTSTPRPRATCSSRRTRRPPPTTPPWCSPRSWRSTTSSPPRRPRRPASSGSATTPPGTAATRASASFAADAVDLIADAVAKVGGDRERIRDVLETSQIDGLSGPIRLTPDNHSGLMPQALTLLVARSGRWRLAS